MVIDVRPERISTDWLFLASQESRSTALLGSHRMTTERGARRLSTSP
jgi:hypothetical protein